MLSIAETKIGVNEANLSVKGFSLLLLWVLSLSFRSEEIIIPSIAMLMSLSDVSDGINFNLFVLHDLK